MKKNNSLKVLGWSVGIIAFAEFLIMSAKKTVTSEVSVPLVGSGTSGSGSGSSGSSPATGSQLVPDVPKTTADSGITQNAGLAIPATEYAPLSTVSPVVLNGVVVPANTVTATLATVLQGAVVPDAPVDIPFSSPSTYVNPIHNGTHLTPVQYTDEYFIP